MSIQELENFISICFGIEPSFQQNSLLSTIIVGLFQIIQFLLSTINTPSMPPKSFNAEGMLRSYALNDVVLARVNRHPFWPAYIRKCSNPDDNNHGRWRIPSPNRDTSLLWCDFIDSASSCWVSTDHIKAFSMNHADYTLRRCRVPRTKQRLGIAIEKTRTILDLPPLPIAPSTSSPLVDKQDSENDVIMGPASTANKNDDDAEMRLEKVASTRALPKPALVTSSEGNTSLEMNPARKSIPIPGDLVLAKIGNYPFWPAHVQKCVSDRPRWNAKWVIVNSKNDKSLRLWCSFIGDNTGGWVPVERIQPYNPEEANKLLSKRKSSLHDMHRKAVSEANELHRTKRRLKLPLPQRRVSSVMVTTARNHCEPSTGAQEPSKDFRAKLGIAEKSITNEGITNSSCTEYSLNDIVLAKFAPACPYWPCLILKCRASPEASGRLGKWKISGEGSTSDEICCFFIADGSETWVPLHDIKRFTQARALSYLCERTSTLYEVQRKAIVEATSMLERRSDIESR